MNRKHKGHGGHKHGKGHGRGHSKGGYNKGGQGRGYGSNKSGRRPSFKPKLNTMPDHRDLIKDLKKQGHVPCIFFAFSRALTQKMANQLGQKMDFLDAQEKRVVVTYVRNAIKDQSLQHFDTTRDLRELLAKGIGFHHAGMLPQLKDIVEHLFGEGLIKVLYATETFAVGINMPAKVVCFQSLEKFDGVAFRHLNSKEYFQLAGRAGRRGIDKEGKAIALIDRRFLDVNKIRSFTQSDTEPLKSYFKLSDNTILNMVHRHDAEKIDIILRSNFGFYLKYGPKAFKEKKRNPLKAVFTGKKNKLEKKGFIHDEKLTEKGKFATHIFRDEVLVSELFYEDFADSLNTYQIMLLAATICYEPKRANRFDKVPAGPQTKGLVKKIENSVYFNSKIDVVRMKRIAGIIGAWHDLEPFEELMTMCNLQEGDLIRLFRQMLDLLTQIRKASHKIELNNRIDDCLNILNREYVQVGF